MDIGRLPLRLEATTLRLALTTPQIVAHLFTLFNSETQLLEETTILDSVSQPRNNDDCTITCCPTCGTPYCLGLQSVSSPNSSGQGDAHQTTCPNAGYRWHARAKDIKQSIDLLPHSHVASLLQKELLQLLSTHLLT